MNKCESNLLSVIVFFLGCKDFQSIAADAIKWFCARFHLIDGHCGCRCHRSRFETISPNMSYTDALLRNSMDVNAIKSININMCALGSRFVYFSLPQQKNRTKSQHPYFVPITWNAHHKYDFYDNILSSSLSLPLPFVANHNHTSFFDAHIFLCSLIDRKRERERNKCEEITSNKFYRLSNSCTSQIRIPHNRSGTTLASKASYWIRKITYSKSHSFFVFFSFFILVWVLTFLVIVSRCW